MRTLLTVAAALTTLVGANGASVARLAAQDRVASALAQVRTALGGEPRLTTVNAISAEGPFRRSVGTRSVEGTMSMLLVRPDRLRRSEESSFFGATNERIATFDGAQAWEETINSARVGSGGGSDHDHGAGGFGGWNGQSGADHNHGGTDDGAQASSRGPNRALTEEQVNAARVRRMKTEFQRWTVAFLADSSRTFTDAGRAESPDGPADVLETSDEAGRPVRYFIDAASHLPLMVQYQEVRPQAMAATGALALSTTAIHLSGYRKVDGLLLPHQIDTSIDGRASESWTIEKFKINPAVKADVFRRK